MSLILRELTAGDEAAFFEGLKEWEGDSLTWYTFAWKAGMSYAEMLEILRKEKAGIDLAPGRVPHTMLYAFVGGKIIGRVSIRHSLNDYLRLRGGHIGYSVAKPWRRQGHATEIVRQGLAYCRGLGLPAILVTCSETNVASWKVIEHFGGTLENKIWDETDKEEARRYWIPLTGGMDLRPTLEGALLRLRPVHADDFEALYAAASDPLIWEQHPASDRYQKDVFRKFFDAALDSRGALAVIDRATGALIGSSRYYQASPERREVTIGYTFLARAYWGGRYNGELKSLMIQHALGFADRVLFEIGETNLRSRKAIEKIGAQLHATRLLDGKAHVVYRIDRGTAGF